MVECEFVACGALSWYIKVLIDTWWNVNDSLPVREIEHNLVLIDTWWNVNYDRLACRKEAFEF